MNQMLIFSSISHIWVSFMAVELDFKKSNKKLVKAPLSDFCIVNAASDVLDG